MVVQSGQVSISSLQRKLRIGFSRAARLVDMMEADGLVSARLGRQAARGAGRPAATSTRSTSSSGDVTMPRLRRRLRRRRLRGRRVPAGAGRRRPRRQPPRERYEAARALDADARAAIERAPDDGRRPARQDAVRRGAAGRRPLREPSCGAIPTQRLQRQRAVRRRRPRRGCSTPPTAASADRTLAAQVLSTWLIREYPASSAAQRRRAPRCARSRPSATRAVATRVRAASARRRRSWPRRPPPRAPRSPTSRPVAAVAPRRRRRRVADAADRSSATVLPDVVRLTLPLDREVPFSHETLDDPPRAFVDLQRRHGGARAARQRRCASTTRCGRCGSAGGPTRRASCSIWRRVARQRVHALQPVPGRHRRRAGAGGVAEPRCPSPHRSNACRCRSRARRSSRRRERRHPGGRRAAGRPSRRPIRLRRPRRRRCRRRRRHAAAVARPAQRRRAATAPAAMPPPATSVAGAHRHRRQRSGAAARRAGRQYRRHRSRWRASSASASRASSSTPVTAGTIPGTLAHTARAKRTWCSTSRCGSRSCSRRSRASRSC